MRVSQEQVKCVILFCVKSYVHLKTLSWFITVGINDAPISSVLILTDFLVPNDRFTLYQMAQSIILEPNAISIRSGYGIYTRIFMGNLVIDLISASHNIHLVNTPNTLMGKTDIIRLVIGSSASPFV